ncbi:MAG TPA: hypothetical protein PK718_06690 [Candidatus Methanofastidiosa archaeon]|nr:hypothetical protein [Candidatus Methanofastidiosa archaeon]
MRFHQVLLIFVIMLFAIMVFNTQAFTSFSTDRAVTLQTTDDRYGLISLEPYGENGIYFTDEAGDGTFEFSITDIPLQFITYENVMTITNNLNYPVKVKILDSGSYEDRVSFTSDAYNLESDGRTIYVGDAIYVDLAIDATGLPGVDLLDSINIVAYQDGNDMYNMHRSVVLATAEEAVYDPYANDMPTNAAYLGELAYEIRRSGGWISEGSDCFEDMGLDPKIWNNNINGYEYSYSNSNGGVIYIKNTREKIYMGWWGMIVNVNRGTGILYSFSEDYYYVRIGRSWYGYAYLISYY